MYVTPEQIQSANKANVEALLAVANAQFAAFEKLANISASAVKGAFENSIANTRALLGAKDVQEFVTLQNSFARLTGEDARLAYATSAIVVRRLMEDVGGPAITSLLRDLGEGREFDAAFERHTGRSWRDLQSIIAAR